MNLNEMFNTSNEKPLDKFVTDGGFTGILRTIGCVGDSLSSGEFESTDSEGNKGYHDCFEFSWGQFMARNSGCLVYNFSRGGMTAKEYCNSFAEENDFWNPDKAARAYIIALGVNDISMLGKNLGSADDVDIKDYRNNKDSFYGNYAKIIQRLKEIQPKAKFFLMTIPRTPEADRERIEAEEIHSQILYEMADMFENTYILDFRKYAPTYDNEFKKKFFLGGHMNAAGYLLTARMVESYIDYIIRANMNDFSQIGFVGTPYENTQK